MGSGPTAAPPRRVVAEEGVQNPLVDLPAAEGQDLRAEGHEAHGQVLVQLSSQMQNGVRPGRPVMAHDHLTAEQAPHQTDEVLQLGGGDVVDAVAGS